MPAVDVWDKFLQQELVKLLSQLLKCPYSVTILMVI